MLLLSESPLRRLRVFISTHFYRNKYDYRIEWLRFVQTLSSADEPDLQRTAVRAVAQIFGSPRRVADAARRGDRSSFTLRATWPESYEGEIECGAIGDDRTRCRGSCANGSG